MPTRIRGKIPGVCIDVTDTDCTGSLLGVPIPVYAKDNRPPIITLGKDLIELKVNKGDKIHQVDATVYDPDGTVVSVQWVKIQGGDATFSDPTIINPFITMPSGSYKFEVTATDNDGASTTKKLSILVENEGLVVSNILVSGEQKLFIPPNDILKILKNTRVLFDISTSRNRVFTIDCKVEIIEQPAYGGSLTGSTRGFLNQLVGVYIQGGVVVNNKPNTIELTQVEVLSDTTKTVQYTVTSDKGDFSLEFVTVNGSRQAGLYRYTLVIDGDTANPIILEQLWK